MIEFLLARIAEDEAQAQALLDRTVAVRRQLLDPMLLGRYLPGWHDWPDVDDMARQAFAECRAKRAIVEELSHDSLGPREWILAQLATVYEDHPDYNNEWAVG